MSQATKKKVTPDLRGGEAVLAKCNMSGQKGRRVKLDATHLLNFTTESHTARGQFGAPSSAHNRARRSKAYTRGYTKEHYLLSNTHFVVRADLDCEGYLACPDQMLPWEDILQIRLITTSTTLCPICLSSPEAARVTKCGHTYCLPCILHFFSLAEGKWEPCPVCGEIINLSDAKPVVTLEKREFKNGDLVNFVKVCRADDLNYPLPCYLDRAYSRQLLSSSDKGVQFAKVSTGNSEFRRQALLTDRAELCAALKNTLCDVEFVHKSLQLLDNELGGAQAMTSPLESADNVCAGDTVEELSYEAVESYDKEISTIHTQEDCVFTYQAADGQYIYLEPLNIAMLREEYGVLSRCPDRIRARVLNITHHVVSEQLRGRYKWLSHLPLMCELQFFEVSLQPPLISRYVMDSFRENIEKRRISRQIKQKKEDVCEKKAAAYWSKTCPTFLPSESVDTILDFSIENFAPLSSTAVDDNVVPKLASSFAQALSQQSVPSKTADATTHSETMDDTQTDITQRERHSSESDDEFTPPSYRESLGDAIANKLDAYLLQKDNGVVPKSKVPSGPRGKRGKGKKIILFSTSAGRPS